LEEKGEKVVGTEFTLTHRGPQTETSQFVDKLSVWGEKNRGADPLGGSLKSHEGAGRKDEIGPRTRWGNGMCWGKKNALKNQSLPLFERRGTNNKQKGTAIEKRREKGAIDLPP